MALPYIPIALAASIVASAAFVVASRRVLHAVAALALVFTESALIFLYLNQILLALLQLLVFVGGLSTYLIVAIAAEEHINKMENAPVFIALSVIFFVGASTLLTYLPATIPPQSNDIVSVAASVFQADYAFLYLAVLLLFAGAIGSTLVARRVVKLVT